ncbi:hypothetical protein F8M41_021656 [Gigaspora margarita]|uniref:Uncharacterized protein n=1 Tax=Gigaspora margarita TaxID=4874 RepID=A0A8H4AGJ4_GIGMA|nr:hypothetical protein F8M41_021656 [Gigaspora margarita]
MLLRGEITCLREYENKSFWGFLLRCRDAATLVTSRWHELDLSWCRHSLEEKLLNENDFNKLEKQINQERQRVKNNIYEYWYYIILECKTKQEIKVHESAILRLQLELNDIQNKAKLQDSSNREIEGDLVNEVLMFVMFGDDDDDANLLAIRKREVILIIRDSEFQIKLTEDEIAEK